MKKFKLIIVLIFVSITINVFGQEQKADDYIIKANELWENQDYKGALEMMSAGIEAMPDSGTLYCNRALIFNAFREYELALDDYTKVINLFDESHTEQYKSNMYSNRGGMKYNIRDFQGSYDDLLMAIQLDSTNKDAINNIAATCDEVGRYDETEFYLRKLINLDPEYVPAYVNLGFMYQDHDKHKKAIECFDKAIALDPKGPLGYSNRSFSKYNLGELEDALADINKSIQLLPVNSYAYKIRALILIKYNKNDAACRDLDKALELGYTKQYGAEVEELKKKYCE